MVEIKLTDLQTDKVRSILQEKYPYVTFSKPLQVVRVKSTKQGIWKDVYTFEEIDNKWPRETLHKKKRKKYEPRIRG